MTQSYLESLKAISIHAPHAYAICLGLKPYEYRSQPTDRRGWILIHASQSKDSDHCLADYGISKDTIKRGAIIGAAQITDCIWDAEFSCYAYHLENPILFDQPIEGVKGCQAIFWGAKTPEKQAAFTQAWEMIQPQSDDISIEAIAPQVLTTGYDLELVDEKTYQVSDSLTQEPLFQVYQGQDGWTNGLTKQTHSSSGLAIAEAREKTIGRIERSRPLEVSQIDSDTFIVKNLDNGNHYVVHPNHPNSHERCECGDTHFRGARCKHQIAAESYLQRVIAQSELKQYIEQQAEEIAPLPNIQFISPDGFYNWEAIADGKTIATISYDSDHPTQRYVVFVGDKEIFRWNTQSRCERHISQHYKQGTLPVVEEEKPEPCTIEDCKFIDDKGQQYTVRINNQLIGYIWLADNGNWINGDGTKYDDWRECGKQLARLTRNDLYQTVAA